MDNLDKFYSLKGHFQVIVKDVVSGKEWVHFEDKNTITYIAKRCATRMFGGTDIASRYIQKMKFSDQGYDYVNSGIYPTNESSAMGAPLLPFVANPLIVNYVDDFTITNTSKVTFTAIMLTSQGNGSPSQNYSQAGLFTVDETFIDPISLLPTSGLFAIKNFAPVVKNSNLQLTFNWSILV